MKLSRLLPLEMLLLLAITLLAWGLRLYRLDAQSLWYDEGVTASLAQRSLVDLTQWTARDIQPPLYYYLVWGWGQLAGWSEWSLRFVSVWWGVLTIPLLAVLVRHLTRQRLAVPVVALLTALHPLLVYYSQEARMYTMLVSLGVLAAYGLLRAGEPGSTWRLWLVYALVATAAVYTHYFAFFLLLALGLAFLTDLLTNRRLCNPNQRLLGYLATHLAIVLLYLVWLGALLQQLIGDTSYWQGRLKIWEALRSVAVRFTSGETVLEQSAVDRLPLYACLTLLLCLAIGWHARRHVWARRTLFYLLCWLVIPIGGVLGLAAFVPKFNARYVLLALPGLLLAWSVGIGILIADCRLQIADWRSGVGGRRLSTGRIGGLMGGGIGLLAGLILLTGFWTATQNWFADPAFTKAQWRELAAYVRTHRQVDEAVVLVSGHAWPIWDYYAPDLPALYLPDLAILDVNTVLDFANTGPMLRAALGDKKGVWLVNWQAEVVDPNGIVPYQLLWTATEQPVTAAFWQLHLRHFVDLDASAIPTAAPITTQLDANFGDQLRLQGYTVTPDDDLLLFWQVEDARTQPLPDLHINLRTETAAGLLYADPADRRPADYGFPVMRWQPGQSVMGHIPAAVWAGPGAIPGHYQVQLGVYDPVGDPAGLDLLDAAGNPVGKFVVLTVNLAQTTSSASLPAGAVVAELATGLRAAFAPDTFAVEPGQPVAVTLYWWQETPDHPLPTVNWQWRSTGTEAVAAEVPVTPLDGTALATWPAGQWLRQVVTVHAPVSLPAGEYWLEIVATGAGGAVARQPFTVLPSVRNFTVPSLAVAVDIDFVQLGVTATPQVRFLGVAQPLPTTVKVNEPLVLELAWQAVAPTAPAANAIATLQWLGPDGRPVVQVDQSLPGGSASWLPGQVELQSLALNAPTTPGHYPVILALYHMVGGSFSRLTTQAGNDFVELGVISVQP